MVTPSFVIELLVEDHVAALGAERDLDRVGEDVDAALERAACVLAELQFLVSHVLLVPLSRPWP
jgi:hypothetical protein